MPSDHGKGSYSSSLGNREMQEHKIWANMARPKCIQPLAQASADCIINCLDNALHLPIALAVASHQLLVHDAKYLAQACEAPLELLPMLHPHVPWLAPSAHDILQELCSVPAV